MVRQLQTQGALSSSIYHWTLEKIGKYMEGVSGPFSEAMVSFDFTRNGDEQP
jgi:hypothetical protein